MHEHHQHNYYLVTLSFIIAMFASYTALDLVSSLSSSKGKIKWLWLIGGSLAMGIGIWSMHFIGMLAFSIHGVSIYYDVPLVILSIVVAVLASALALYLIADKQPTIKTYTIGSLVMGSAIAGMHYIGIASMIMSAEIHWNYFYVFLSVLVAIGASCAALFASFKLREDVSLRGFAYRGLGGVLMGIAIAGMHYTGMAAMSFTIIVDAIPDTHQTLLATDSLAAAVIIGTILILALALTGANIDRALTKRSFINDLLKEGIHARDKFLSIASHELKTPLTSLKLQVQIILRHIESEEFEKQKAIKMLNKTDLSLNRIDSLVNDMLDISRITSGKLSFNKERSDLYEMIMDVVERVKPQFDQAGVALDVHGKSVFGHFDMFRIEQVLSNLLSNALKYGRKMPVEVSLVEKNGKAIIEVRDQGHGIPEDCFEKIFNRFERLNETSEISGLGLGLYIVKEIITAHGGSIVIESSYGIGSTFRIELPLKEAT